MNLPLESGFEAIRTFKVPKGRPGKAAPFRYPSGSLMDSDFLMGVSNFPPSLAKLTDFSTAIPSTFLLFFAIDGPTIRVEELDLVTKMDLHVKDERYSDVG
ncbi:unnamed protein product [Lactuca saligna]|uniref:Uncharacterized protein n=1 Tax=Lactuca saligna TaxID=75948 RepID=A0AA35ZDI2_LACSI|nr:unnamed protein product [Lactuca saligna]